MQPNLLWSSGNEPVQLKRAISLKSQYYCHFFQITVNIKHPGQLLGHNDVRSIVPNEAEKRPETSKIFCFSHVVSSFGWKTSSVVFFNPVLRTNKSPVEELDGQLQKVCCSECLTFLQFCVRLAFVLRFALLVKTKSGFPLYSTKKQVSTIFTVYSQCMYGLWYGPVPRYLSLRLHCCSLLFNSISRAIPSHPS